MIQKKFTATKFYALPLILVALAAAGTMAFQPGNDIYFLIKKNFGIFSKAYENVAIEYVDEVDPELLMQNGIRAMLETLDPYTVLYNAAENEEAEILSTGNFAGIGIEAGWLNGNVVIIAPMEGGPADKKGIRAGDIIVAVDGIETEGLSIDEVQRLTAGELGSKVVLSIKRFGDAEPIDFELEREIIELKNIGHTDILGKNSDIGYVKLNQFGARSGDEIREAIDKLSSSKNLSGLILDLRDNPGGILQESVRIVDKFIEPGIRIVETKGRLPEHSFGYSSEEPVMFSKPVVVLMNGGSASASEVTAGALQDLDRAVVLGEQSFGKGLVQIVKPLPYNNSLKITISRYYTPSGRSIQSLQYMHSAKNTPVMKADSLLRVYKTKNGREVLEGRGIEPDVIVEPPPITPLQTALFRQNMYFDFATQFKTAHAIFAEAEISESVYNEFLAFLKSRNFDFEPPAQQLLSKLTNEMGETSIQNQLNAISDAIQKQKETDLKEEKAEIKRQLLREILSRYEGSSRGTTSLLNSDIQIIKALELLENPSQIQRILSGK